MPSTTHPDFHAEFSFSSLSRAADRSRLLVQVIGSVWDSILQLPLLAREHQEAGEVSTSDLPLICGYIRISGAWEGAVAMTCPRTLAAKCAAIMHGRSADELTEAEIRDGWGELVNMVGGNLKALVPAVSRLGLPTVREREIFGYEEEGSRVLNDVTFACLGHRLRLTVLQPER